MEPVHYAVRIVAACIVIGFAALAFWGAQPPCPLSKDAPQDRFSGMRALDHSRAIMTEPHPAGSIAIEKVQKYIVDALASYGVEVEVDPIHVNEGRCIGVVENVMARIPGTGGQETFGLTAHYDSVAFGPGAADDGSGVVVMLETARLLKQGPPLKNDVVFIFTGDEEHGMGGASRSLHHRWLQNLNVLLAFEARGNHGPAFMFETSAGNLPLMRELAACPGAPPESTSLMWEVHHRTPNNTDFGSMKHHGVLGYNVAFVGGLGYYHTANDNPAMLSPASLQHQGEYAVSLARHYGNSTEKMRQGEDAVFFNTLGYHLVVYPASWGLPIAILAGLMTLISLAYACWQKHVTLAGTGMALLRLVWAMALAGLTTYVSLQLTYRFFYVYLTYESLLYLLAFLFIAFSYALSEFQKTARRFGADAMLAAALVFWLIALGVLQYMLPAGSYAAAWPLIFGAGALALGTWLKQRSRPGAALIAQTVLGLPALAFLVPGIQAFYYMGPGLTIIPCALLAIAGASLFAPAVCAVFGDRKWHRHVLEALGALLMIYGWLHNGYTPAHPKMSSLAYAVNFTTQKAAWLSTDDKPDAYTTQFFKNEYQRTSVKDLIPGRVETCLVADAPIAPIAPPQIDMLSDTTENGRRTVTLRYTSASHTEQSRLVVLSPGEVLAASAEDFGALREGKTPWDIDIPVMPRSSVITLSLTIPANQPLRLRVDEDAFRMLDVFPPGSTPRPSDHIPKPNTLDWWESKIRGTSSLTSNHTYMTKEFAL